MSNMTFEEWVEAYKPKVVPEGVVKAGQYYLDPEDPATDVTIETFDSGWEHVRAVAQENIGRVWTVVIGDDGWTEVLINGLHYCNRMYYIITEKPYIGRYMEVEV